MRYRSTLAAASLLCAQSAFAFDASTLNFEQQAYDYSNTYGFAPTALSDNSSLETDKGMRFNDAPSHRLPKYLTTAPEKDWDYLMGQTYTILGLSVATVGMMTFLPESVTNWTAEDRDFSNLASKWWDNVSEGPVWDKDDHYLNYVMHPYFGGVYYTAARHSGFNEFESFVYSFTMSTFFWEYGVESFAEVPSIQDIIVTPLFGAAVGEWMYLTEQDIVADGGEVLGSETLGGVSLFFLNPVGHIHHWVTSIWQGDTEVKMNYNPWFDNKEAMQYAMDSGAGYDAQFIGMQVSLKF
ncbi:DUF3943 domain-containing protein [Enterovibrio sp. ZSDZ35]|uniref:DUF3943 domain-containing protein n=1 Tax=Enterovibrio qingdaonensis TaxID=2899818 RepID=A0ABT5QL86_9GAMM|nr:DUF3943 domain-containing protein [Enterovibrio sp. ZSDZ35]MDD1781750.1 DUF3943 domain-containing protein [Enterovibrio sp. ZSDZ35]